MNHLINKINHLKWLSAVGVDYYFLEPDKQLKLLTHTKSPSSKLITFPMSKNHSANPTISQRESSIKPKIENANINSLKNTNDTDSPNQKVDELSNTLIAVQLARELADEATSLEELRKSLMEFEGCNLKKLANNTVFADGNPSSSIMLIGEAPGSTEDARGIPFCGESGQLLDNILASINISRQHNAYITNTVFWRPPANRQPTLAEIDICRPFVEKHIALINPKLIVLVGNVAATSLLGKNAGVTKIRQEYYWYSNPYLIKPIQTTAIFHPAYLLRQPAQKKTTWYDLLKIQEFVNINSNTTNS